MSNVFTESHTKERGYEKTLARKSWNKMAGDSADGCDGRGQRGCDGAGGSS